MIQNTKISIIAAIDEKRGIGKNNEVPFRIPEDLKRLKELTTGHPLVMGRKTFESLGRLLPGRTHIVITRDPESLKQLLYQPDVVAGSLEEALEESIKYQVVSSMYDKKDEKIHDTKYIIHNTENEVFIFGGGEIFKQAIEKGLVDRLYLTIVEGDYGADTFFPEYPEFTKVIEDVGREEEGYKYKFLTLEK
ncbi:MAG TPA: dihydrofolate reductase [Candidatus Saccharimonadales bacterium]|nr:dihydrofolate reductase [Candidatus Saccharimonadales bacterium]